MLQLPVLVASMRSTHDAVSPIARGSAIAVAAAVLFGATAPLVKHFAQETGPFATAALLLFASYF